MVLILVVTLVAIGGIGTHELAVLGAGALDGLDLLARVAAVELVKQVQKAHDVRAAVVTLRIHSIVKSHKAAAYGGEQVVCVLSYLDVVAPKAAEVFDQYEVDTLRLCILDETLYARPVEVRTRVSVVYVDVDLVPAHLPHIALQQQLLVLDADGFAVAFIVV